MDKKKADGVIAMFRLPICKTFNDLSKEEWQRLLLACELEDSDKPEEEHTTPKSFYETLQQFHNELTAIVGNTEDAEVCAAFTRAEVTALLLLLHTAHFPSEDKFDAMTTALSFARNKLASRDANARMFAAWDALGVSDFQYRSQQR
jgi:hypothetical protein